MKTLEIKLNTLTCPSCVRKIENTLNKENGVESAKVYFNLSKVKTDFNEEVTSDETLVKIVQKLGFEVIEYDVY